MAIMTPADRERMKKQVRRLRTAEKQIQAVLADLDESKPFRGRSSLVPRLVSASNKVYLAAEFLQDRHVGPI